MPEAALPAKVAECLQRAGVGQGSRLLLALSGGLDSMVLLELLAALREPFGFMLEAAHVHHGLNPAADDWLERCAARALALGVGFHGLRVEVPRGDPQGLEAAARRMRHAALASISCDWRLYAHHQDDQAETLLFRLLRGSGVSGAAAMRPILPGSPGVLRPLLDCSRSEILAWAQHHGLDWVEDDSNYDTRFARNYLRHELMPRLCSRWPAAGRSLARAAAHFAEADELLGELACIDLQHCALPQGQGLSRGALCRLTSSRLRNLLRYWLHEQQVLPPSAQRLDEIAQRLLRETVAWRLPLGEQALCVYRDRVWLEPSALPRPQPQRWQGEAELLWAGSALRMRACVGEGLSAAALAGGEVWLTGRDAGTRLRLAQGRPRQCFKNLAQRAGIPPWLRERLPVLRLDGEPVWIAGLGLAAEYAARPGEPGLCPEWWPG